MKIWTITNQKGGVGKTTSVVTLGGILASAGERVLLVDLDPHGSLTSYFRLDPDDIDKSVYNLFQSMVAKKPLDPQSLIQATKTPGLDLLPASTALATLDRQVGVKDGMGLVLATSLKKLESEYSYALIDTPPMLGVLMVNALAACNHLVIPVQTEFLALKGLERMLHTLSMIFKSTKREIDYTVVPTMFDQRTKASKDSLRALREQYPDNTWKSAIPVDTRFRDASSSGVPPSIFAPSARGVEAYEALLQALDARQKAEQ
ncbi:MAG: ParA family protein [Methylococcales bacterium]|jgi:chromosome partitioning protein|nr:ParA family protein [Methylococcales bacterium]MBT7444996.1 ParA family protein [Methylococcales bacterium]